MAKAQAAKNNGTPTSSEIRTARPNSNVGCGRQNDHRTFSEGLMAAASWANPLETSSSRAPMGA